MQMTRDQKRWRDRRMAQLNEIARRTERLETTCRWEFLNGTWRLLRKQHRELSEMLKPFYGVDNEWPG